MNYTVCGYSDYILHIIHLYIINILYYILICFIYYYILGYMLNYKDAQEMIKQRNGKELDI